MLVMKQKNNFHQFPVLVLSNYFNGIIYVNAFFKINIYFFSNAILLKVIGTFVATQKDTDRQFFA